MHCKGPLIVFLASLVFSNIGFDLSFANEQSLLVDAQQAGVPRDVAWDDEPVPDSGFMVSHVSSALQMFLALLCVVALAYLILHKGLGAILRRQRIGERVKIRERIPLDSKHSLFLVDVDGRLLLLATSESGVQVISRAIGSKPNFSTIRSNLAAGAS